MNKLRILFLLLVALLVVSCGESGYLETFENSRAWSDTEQEGVSGAVVDEQLHLTVDLPESMFYTTMGRRNLEDGVFELDVQALDGSAESAFGLVFRATPNSTDFYYFLVSVDGFYSIGGCQNGCLEGDLIRIADNMWIQSDAIEQGLNQPHSLRVEAIGDSLAYFINGVEIGRFSNTAIPKGDIGILLQTFDSSATVAFDNLRFTPIEETNLATTDDA